MRRLSRIVVVAAVGVSIVGCSGSGDTTNPTIVQPVTAPSPAPTEPPTVPSTSPTAASGPASTTGPATTIVTTTAPATTIVTTTAPATSAPATTPCGRAPHGSNSYHHVIWIWMENKSTDSVLGSPEAPFLNDIAAQCGSATNYSDNGVHPSLPNYIAATSGDPQGITDDSGPAAHPLMVDNIFRQVRATGKMARSYQEGMPTNCMTTSTGRYAVKHNPEAYYIGGDDRANCERDNVPFTQFATDLATDALPAFSFVTPDLCNDMHDCSVGVGDAWLKELLTSITASDLYRSDTTAVFVVWDESVGGGTMPFVAVVPSLQPGTRTDTRLDHYSLLAFTEDALGIPNHLGATAGAPSLATALGL